MPEPLVDDDHGRAVVAEVHLVPPDADLVLTGEIDLHNLDQLTAVLDAAIALPTRYLAVDLSAVRFASVRALGAVADTAPVLDGRGGRLTVRGASALHRRVLALLGTPPGPVVASTDAG